jgi:hypothetical protein
MPVRFDESRRACAESRYRALPQASTVTTCA